MPIEQQRYSYMYSSLFPICSVLSIVFHPHFIFKLLCWSDNLSYYQNMYLYFGYTVQKATMCLILFRHKRPYEIFIWEHYRHFSPKSWSLVHSFKRINRDIRSNSNRSSLHQKIFSVCYSTCAICIQIYSIHPLLYSGSRIHINPFLLHFCIMYLAFDIRPKREQRKKHQVFILSNCIHSIWAKNKNIRKLRHFTFTSLLKYTDFEISMHGSVYKIHC